MSAARWPNAERIAGPLRYGCRPSGDVLIAKDVILVPGCGRGTSELHLQLVPASCIPPPAAFRVLTAGVKTPRRGCIHITSIELEEKPLQERHFLFLLQHPKSPQVRINVPTPGLDKYLVCRLHISAGTP